MLPVARGRTCAAEFARARGDTSDSKRRSARPVWRLGGLRGLTDVAELEPPVTLALRQARQRPGLQTLLQALPHASVSEAGAVRANFRRVADLQRASSSRR